METLTERNLLLLWEKNLHKPLIEKNLALLGLAYPEYRSGEPALWSVGERDARLLEIREALFGRVLENTAECPACGLKTEWEMQTDSLRLQPIGDGAAPRVMTLASEAYQVRFRLPNSADMLDILSLDNPDAGTDALIRRCIVESDFPLTPTGELPPELKSRIIQEMEQHDPQADISLQLSCPDCKHEWVLGFDIMQYLWTEINDWAYRTIRDIGLLAYHFGWSEKDILEMSRLRRSMYLNMING